MKISVQSMGLTPHAPLEEHIEKKLNKLENYYDRIVEAKVFLKAENKTEKDNKTVEIILAVPGEDIVVKKTSTTFEQSLDQCVEVAKKLLIKKKETA
ncbi:ribosome hibernation-promoting factor, HPF/YfiA family [Chryseobacterium sp. MFBS3-17]|uniref:ribosome hibernation-promoting factor, HPF/YfiA family n=1 Tax=Chryseobacterium sp. MFBS3-17 TaxID=2886689 RepID=UPI001D0F1BEF|nr:ribosome-associated translation inhibitor RaiA [Chryseobacterium sp. MFBS3-17]MCC2589764.1 ribosome-associated translation inhibitor RaiA [Chryseobacterium sp. MFBS3-17]